MSFTMLPNNYWIRPEIKKLGFNQKGLLIYLTANTHSHFSGIYYLPLPLIEHETGLTRVGIDEMLQSLIDAELLAIDQDNEILWVKDRLKGEKKSDQQLKAVAKQLKSLPKCQLINDFLAHYQDLKIPYEYPTDTPSIPYREGICYVNENADVDENTDGEVKDHHTGKKVNAFNGRSFQMEPEIYEHFRGFWKTYPDEMFDNALKCLDEHCSVTRKSIDGEILADLLEMYPPEEFFKNYKNHLGKKNGRKS